MVRVFCFILQCIRYVDRRRVWRWIRRTLFALRGINYRTPTAYLNTGYRVSKSIQDQVMILQRARSRSKETTLETAYQHRRHKEEMALEMT